MFPLQTISNVINKMYRSSAILHLFYLLVIIQAIEQLLPILSDIQMKYAKTSKQNFTSACNRVFPHVRVDTLWAADRRCVLRWEGTRGGVFGRGGSGALMQLCSATLRRRTSHPSPPVSGGADRYLSSHCFSSSSWFCSDLTGTIKEPRLLLSHPPASRYL